MEKEIRAKMAAILSKRDSPDFCLWSLIKEKLMPIGFSEKLIRNAFIFVFIDIKKYTDAFASLSLQQDCVDDYLAPLLLLLFTCIKKINPEQCIYPQLAIYFSNITILLENLSWATWLCEKLTKLDNGFLVELLEIDPFNRNLANAIPDAFLLKRLKNYSHFINENTAALQKTMSASQNNIIFFSTSFTHATQSSPAMTIPTSQNTHILV